MNKDKFVKAYIERLVDKDPEVHTKFENADEEERKILTGRLKNSLEKSYDVYAKDYFDHEGLGSYVSTFLRTTGAANDLMGTYFFWTMGGAGLGLKGIGLAEKSIADFIDSRRASKYSKGKLTEKLYDDAKTSAEMLAERAAAYSPFTFGVGEIADLMRGRSKFDGKIVGRAAYYGRNDFLKYENAKDEESGKIGKEPEIIALTNFLNPYYAEKAGETNIIKLADYKSKEKKKAS